MSESTSSDQLGAIRQEQIATVRRGLSLECDGCTFDDEGRFITLSPTCTLHGQAEAALAALDALLEERDARASDACRWERDWHKAQHQIGEHTRIQVGLSDTLNEREAELASLRRDALRWADETYDESMARRIRERLDA